MECTSLVALGALSMATVSVTEEASGWKKTLEDSIYKIVLLVIDFESALILRKNSSYSRTK